MAKEQLLATRAVFEAVIAGFPPNLDIEYRHMFGGIGIYVRGRIFALIFSNGDLALKLPDEGQPELLALEGAARAEPSPRQYVRVPPGFLSDTGQLVPWLQRSIDHAMTLPLPKRKRRS